MQAIIKTRNIRLLMTYCCGDLKGWRVKDGLRVLDGGEVAQGVCKVKVSGIQNLEVAFRHIRTLHLTSSKYCFPLATVSHASRQNSSLVWSTRCSFLFLEFIFHLFCPSFLLLLLAISWKRFGLPISFPFIFFLFFFSLFSLYFFSSFCWH